MIEVNTEAELEALPDGTIIRWLRIPGDSTSEAVAFVRQQIEADHDIDNRQVRVDTVTWISPGGWQPMTVEDAGITYPVEVVRFGETSTLAERVAAVPPQIWPADNLEALTGGTWAREKALDAAARVHQQAGYAGHTVKFLGDKITDLAEVFEAWLDRDAEPEDSMSEQGELVATMASDLAEVRYLGSARTCTWEAQRLVIDKGWRK